MDNKIQHSLNDLIEIAHDGGDFYTEAAGKVKDSELSALFSQMASHKRDIVAGLAANMGTVAATYGYLGSESNAREWGAHAEINFPLDLLQLLNLA